MADLYAVTFITIWASLFLRAEMRFMEFILSLDLQSPVCFATCYVYEHTPHIVIWRLGNDRAWGYTMKGVDGWIFKSALYHYVSHLWVLLSIRKSERFKATPST